MAKRYFQRNTADHPAGGVGHDLKGTTGSPAELSYDIQGGAIAVAAAQFTTAPGEPNAAAWNGELKGQYHVLAIGADLTFTPRFARMNASGTQQQFASSSARSGVGFHEFGVIVDWPDAVESDRFQLRVAVANANMMNTQALTLQVNTADSYAEGPWTDGGEEPPPPAPVTSPATNIESDRFTANWQAAEGADGYRLDVEFVAFPVAVITDLDVGNVLSHVVENLNPDTQYQYRVRAYNAGGTSGDSDTRFVTTASEGQEPPPEATVTVELNDPPDSTEAALQATAGGVTVTVTVDDPADATQAALNVEAVPTYAVPLEYTATDADRGDSDVIAMWYILNDAGPVALPITPGVTVGGNETIDLPAGSYTLTVYAEDSAGNVGSLTRTFTVNS